MADLVVEIVEGPDVGRQLALDRPLDIGRDPGMSIALESDRQTSRRHARITPQNGGAVVEDLGSANGTFVNDQPIHSPRSVRAGDRVRLGLSVLELRSAQQVQQRPSAVRPRQQFTVVDNVVVAPGPGGQVDGFAPPPAAAAPLPPQPSPPLPGARRPAPPVGPGAGFRAAESPAGYVPAEVVGDEEAESAYGALAGLVDARVKQRRNIAAFALLGTSGLAVLLYFGLT